MVRWISLVLVGLISSGCTASQEGGAPVIADIHGLALDPDVPTRLYVATHHGLFVAENDTAWAAVTGEPFDMMGFTMHPGDGSVMYASGHPNSAGQGWAVGVVKSTDGGRTWTTLSLQNQVDFHAMAIEAGTDGVADILYGFHAGKLYVSTDAGATWESQALAFQVASIAVEPGTGSVVVATGEGLRRNARALGDEWSVVSADPSVAIAIAPHAWVGYFSSDGLRASVDGGGTWSSLNWTVPAGDFPWGIAIGPAGTGVFYVGTARGEIHKTADAGVSWHQIV